MFRQGSRRLRRRFWLFDRVDVALGVLGFRPLLVDRLRDPLGAVVERVSDIVSFHSVCVVAFCARPVLRGCGSFSFIGLSRGCQGVKDGVRISGSVGSGRRAVEF